MTRVMVIGNAGGGKSTLCRAICAAHSLPYFAIDKIQWRPNWVRTPEDVFRQIHDDILAKDLWVIDGYGPMNSVEQRLSSCDTVIFVDHPFRIHLWWATKRQFRSLFFGSTRWARWLPDVAGHVSRVQDDVVASSGGSTDTR